MTFHTIQNYKNLSDGCNINYHLLRAFKNPKKEGIGKSE